MFAAALSLGACVVDDAPIDDLGDATTLPPTTAIARVGASLVPLYHWFDAATGDNLATSDPAWAGLPGDTRGNYRFVRVDAWIHDPAAAQPAGSVPVYGWFNSAVGDYFTTTNPTWAGSPGAVRNGYRFQRIEGYVLTASTAHTVPLRSWWNGRTADNFVTADPRWAGPIGGTRGEYYHFRIEGHAFAGDTRADLKRFTTAGLPTASGTPELFRHQAGTRRCQVFAVTAALEAAYARAGIRVDLSEQFLGVMAKMTFLGNPTDHAGLDENQLGLADGGGGALLLWYLENGMRVPEENPAMPFLDEWWPWASITHPDGNPWSLPQKIYQRQKRLNDFNHGPLVRTLAGVSSSWRTLPQVMLSQARTYGASAVEVLCDQNCASTSPAAFEQVLRDGHELVVDAYDGIHMVLIVGYDRTDPSNPHFLVKNSYGFEVDGEDGFLRFGYDQLSGVKAASYITAIRPVAPWHESRFFGRWHLSFDGHRGELDIYHLPGIAQHLLARYRGFTGPDRRLGTFRDAAGTMYRVNGSISGDRLTFYLDAARPALPWDVLSGRRFEYTLSGNDLETMAGVHHDGDGTSYAGYARKEGHVFGVSGVDGTPFSSLRGTWEVLADGRRDRLVMSVYRVGVDHVYRVSGRYEIAGGATHWFDVAASAGFLTLPLGTGMSLRFAPLNHQHGTLAGTLSDSTGGALRTIGVAGRRLGP